MRTSSLGFSSFGRSLAVAAVLGVSLGAARAQYTGVLLAADGIGQRAYGGFQAGRSPMSQANSHPFVWNGTAASGMDLLPSNSIYNRGTSTSIWASTVGVSLVETSTNVWHLFLRDLNSSSMVEFGTGGAPGEHITLFDNDGTQQIGMIGLWFQPPFAHASLWSGTPGSLVDLNPPGAVSSYGYGCRGGVQVGAFTNDPGGIFSGGPFYAVLWTGTAASAVNLNPPGSYGSVAYAIDGLEQGGAAFGNPFGGRAAVWHGSAASYMDITPPGFAGGQVLGIGLGHEVGIAVDAQGYEHAVIWSHTADSAIDLDAFLPADLPSSLHNFEAIGIDPITGDIVGTAYNDDFSESAAVFWKADVPATPAQVIQSTSNQVQALVTTNDLSSTAASSLQAKLDSALADAAPAVVGAALQGSNQSNKVSNPHRLIASLRAFINQTLGYVNSRKLTRPQGQLLIDYTNSVIKLVQDQSP